MPDTPDELPAVLAGLAALPGVDDAARAARGEVDRLRGHPVLRRRAELVSTEAALRGAQASAALEGADLPLGELRGLVGEGVEDRVGQGLDDPPQLGQVGAPSPRAVALGALRVSAGLGALLPVWSRAPLQALARAHLLAAGGSPAGMDPARPAVLSPDLVGRPRPDERHSDPLGLGPAPRPAEVGARLDALAQLLVVPTSAPAIVTAAVVHGELLVLQPFAWGSGLVARAAQRLVLMDRGVDPQALSVPEAGHRDLGVASYAGAARAYATGTPEGVAQWLRHCADAVRRGAGEGLAICQAVQRGGGVGGGGAGGGGGGGTSGSGPTARAGHVSRATRRAP